MPRDWQARVNDLSPVGKLVHLASRMDDFDVARIRGELLAVRRRAYEDELKIQARRAGCGERSARLQNGPSLTALSEMSDRDARSIVNTYNWDLAGAIEQIRQTTPRANRYAYASRLETWETQRNAHKAAEIAQFTELSARALAQRDFATMNGLTGTAELAPKTAKEPICAGWIRRGKVPLAVAMNNPPPYHSNCPHYWITRYDKATVQECQELWMGE